MGNNIENVALFFTVFLFIVCIFIKKDEYFNGNCKQTIDSITYSIQDLPDKHIAAQKLHDINQKIFKLINYLHEKSPTHYGVIRLKKRYKPESLSELHKGSSNTSYSVNKGEKIVVCLRSKEDNSFHDENTIFFVVLHELAHIMTKSIGHKKEFWDNFRYLLKHSILIKLYRYQDFNNKPEKYCGIEITDTPLKI